MKVILLTCLLFFSSLSQAHCRDQVAEDLGHKMDLWEQRFYVTLGVGPFTMWPITAVTGTAGVVIMVPIVAAIFATGKIYNNAYLRYNIVDLDGNKIDEVELKKIVERVFKKDLKKLAEKSKQEKLDKMLAVIADGNESEELCPKKIIGIDEETEENIYRYKYLNLKRIKNYVRNRI